MYPLVEEMVNCKMESRSVEGQSLIFGHIPFLAYVGMKFYSGHWRESALSGL